MSVITPYNFSFSKICGVKMMRWNYIRRILKWATVLPTLAPLGILFRRSLRNLN